MAGTESPRALTPLPAVLAVTFMASLGTGVFWHGVPFIAKHSYGFTQQRNLVLYVCLGALYALGAFSAGRVTRRVERWLHPRSFLGAVLLGQGLVCLLPLAVEAQWALWITSLAVTLLSSMIWPVVESYLSAGRHGAQMRRAIGWFNVVWMPAMAVPMFAMAPILERHGVWTFAGLAVANLAALPALLRFARAPAEHDDEAGRTHVTAVYPFLLRSARVLLPLSYVLSSIMSPILPFRFEQLGVRIEWETPSTATWMIVRVVALVIMWRLPFWHGRWGTLLLGGLAMAGGFATIVLAPALPLMLAGFAALGVGLGVVYYAALYYAMAVGRAGVDAGGTHEALIGVGYGAGPLLGLIGTGLGGGPAIVAVALLAVALCAVPAVRPYWRWKVRKT